MRYGLTVNAGRRELESTTPYLRVANVGREFINLEDVKEIGSTNQDLQTYQLKLGDVLIVEGHANIHEIGRSAIWKHSDTLMLHQNHLIRVRCGDILNPRYLSAYINGPRGRGYFQGMAKSTSGLNTINSTVVKELKVPAISIEAQLEFVSELDVLEQNQANAANQIEVQQQLLKSLLNQIF